MEELYDLFYFRNSNECTENVCCSDFDHLHKLTRKEVLDKAVELNDYGQLFIYRTPTIEETEAIGSLIEEVKLLRKKKLKEKMLELKKKQTEWRKEQTELERAEYLRLKAKFEKSSKKSKSDPK